jgi:protein arginine kinase activator
MKCDKCGSPNVVTKIVIQNDKGTEELNLCPVCFQSFVKDHPGISSGPAGKSVNEFLVGALNYLNNGLKSLNEKENITQSDTRICPACSNPFMRIKKERMAGCSKCYVFFKEEIDNFLYRTTGKHYPDNELAPDDPASIESLKNRLSEALRSENYEMAAALRDKLKKIK